MKDLPGLIHYVNHLFRHEISLKNESGTPVIGESPALPAIGDAGLAQVLPPREARPAGALAGRFLPQA
jgi:hypothetical protein